MLLTISNWLNRNKRKRLHLIRKDKSPTGYISYLFIDGIDSGYALDTYGLKDRELTVKRTAIVVDEFTEPHIDNVIVLEPLSVVYGSLASTVQVTIDSDHMALEC